MIKFGNVYQYILNLAPVKNWRVSTVGQYNMTWMLKTMLWLSFLLIDSISRPSCLHNHTSYSLFNYMFTITCTWSHLFQSFVTNSLWYTVIGRKKLIYAHCFLCMDGRSGGGRKYWRTAAGLICPHINVLGAYGTKGRKKDWVLVGMWNGWMNRWMDGWNFKVTYVFAYL